MAADPSVSPADTLRLAKEWVEEFRDSWNWPESDGELDRAAVWTTLDEAATLAEEMAALAAALLAVGERDKAEESAHTSLRVELANIFGPVKPREGQTWNEAMLARIVDVLARYEDSGERDKRKIAQLTEALERARVDLAQSAGNAWEHGPGGRYAIAEAAIDRIDAVLADEEDAAHG